MQSIAVFCGSSLGYDKVYQSEARFLGQTLARKGIRVVFGGGNIGLMGTIADAALGQGGKVLGVIPRFLEEKEVAHSGLTNLIIVETMHERKMKMHQESDGVLVLPGGFGTMEEFFEMITWGQLGLHHKPIGILNTNGFYDNLLGQVDRMYADGFLNKNNRNMILTHAKIEALLHLMDGYRPFQEPDGIAPSQT